MTKRNYTNTATEGALATSATATDLSFSLSSFAGFPAVPFTAVLDRGTASEEVVLVTAVSGTTATATRGYDATTAKSHAAGAQFLHVAVAKDYEEAGAHIAATTGVHGLTGGLVGLSEVQTLANKTLTSPAISAPTVSGTAAMASATLSGSLTVTGTTTLTGLLTVNGLNVNGSLAVLGGVNFFGSATIGGTLSVTGATTVATPTASGHATTKSYVDNYLATGSVSINVTANNTPISTTISFGKTFPSPPIVVVTPVTSVPGTGVTGVSAYNVSTTGCTVAITRATGTGNTAVMWIAAPA